MKNLDLIDFIKTNISAKPYAGARHAITDSLKKKAKKDINMFKVIEASRLNQSLPLIGDAIIRKDGRVTFIGRFTDSGKFQDTEGGSFYVEKNGATYSGGFTFDVKDVKSLKPTDIKTHLSCWSFSGGNVGGNMGVHKTIMVKTWQEV